MLGRHVLRIAGLCQAVFRPSQTDLWYQMAGSSSHEQETAPQGHDEVKTMKTGMW